MCIDHSPQMHLKMLLQDFHSITHINISYLSMRSEHDLAAPLHFSVSAENMNGFLSQLHRVHELKERIALMEADAVAYIKTHPEAFYSYHPVPGLTSFVFPVYSRSILLGCLLLGPIRDKHHPEFYYQKQLSSLCHIHNLDTNAMMALYEQLPVYENPAIMASSRLLSQIVVYASSIDSPALQSPPLSARIVEYIDAQYMNAISPSTACEHFHISRTTLSRTLSRDLNDTFLSVLSHRRIRNVCKCLEDGLSPEEASMLSGFSSPLYMARVFRTIMGCTPHAYRKKKNEYRSTQQEETKDDAQAPQ